MEPPIRDFPYKAREDGSCEKLKNNLCSVYEDRPLLCNIDRMADETDIPVSKETWFDLNYKGCEILQMEIRQ
jgi:Fe-S-cluster containining protein